LAAGRSLKFVPCQCGSGEALAQGTLWRFTQWPRTPNLPIERRTLCYWAIPAIINIQNSVWTFAKKGIATLAWPSH